MKTDNYTKTILTIIAVALVINVFQNMNIVNEANAGKTDFNKFASVPLNNDGSINVKVVSDMDVNIRSIGGSSVYGALPINLKEIGGSSFYGAIPMNLKEVSGSSISSSYGIPVNIEAVDGSSIYGAVPVKDKP
ncbi:MAG: hypothetical protein J0L87_10395 [Bacteroidetes bacterium]|nr:hypothetical protein [Bacteroidota bacterium]